MKKIYCYLLFLSLCFTACSLDVAGSDPDGKWDEMKLSKKEVHFDHTGGTDTIFVKNYSRWWFSSACNEECTDGNYILPDGPETENVGFNHITGGWWSAEVLKDSPNKVVITANGAEICLSEDCGKEVFPRKAIVTMTAGDIFKTFVIYQD
ncbi:hypothetical protein [uncultured Fibrobacter sp.]|uniref:hypothetical protein n=1 Tax=uncultured Fibrobacter sp. TaxID=261512 RepID=UPI0025CD820D|nr:hypothetical protein [uncultured Fibrobacter sp.]